jgi:RecJ-like exonuclease
MKRRSFLAAIPALAAASCARMDQREKRYDETECPFCVPKPGTCFYCGGTTKCSFCNGTGIRKTGTPDIAEEGIQKASYEEKCPYCEGSGVCRYCKGSGKCWACDGTGKVTSWDFYEKYMKLTRGEQNPPGDTAAQGGQK